MTWQTAPETVFAFIPRKDDVLQRVVYVVSTHLFIQAILSSSQYPSGSTYSRLKSRKLTAGPCHQKQANDKSGDTLTLIYTLFSQDYNPALPALTTTCRPSFRSLHGHKRLSVGEKSEAFAKGGCGCLLSFLAIGLFFVLIGGSMHIDIGGAIMLFVIGGVIGLAVLAVYNKGKGSSS